MLYGIINSRGYITSIQDAYMPGTVELALPEAATQDKGFRYRYVDGAWTDGFAGVSDADLIEAYVVIQQAGDVIDIKAELLPMIKVEAARQIEATDWKVQRAAEVDAATGSATLAVIYTERAAIRSASNVKETALAALNTHDEIAAFNATDF